MKIAAADIGARLSQPQRVQNCPAVENLDRLAGWNFLRLRQPRSGPQEVRAFTLIQFMVAFAVGSVVLSAVAYMSWFATRSFVAIGNYTDLDAKSRNTLDVMGRELRQATSVVSFQTNGNKFLVLTNADIGSRLSLKYDSDARILSFSCTNPQLDAELSECDHWHFSLYQRTPLVTASNIIFYPATNVSGFLDPSLCKVINMSWQCSRTSCGIRSRRSATGLPLDRAFGAQPCW